MGNSREEEGGRDNDGRRKERAEEGTREGGGKARRRESREDSRERMIKPKGDLDHSKVPEKIKPSEQIENIFCRP